MKPAHMRKVFEIDLMPCVAPSPTEDGHVGDGVLVAAHVKPPLAVAAAALFPLLREVPVEHVELPLRLHREAVYRVL